MISDLIAFLNARLDEIEGLANQAQPWPYGSDPATAWIGIPGPNPLYVWAHMTTHDPARVLREVAAKRAMLNMFLDAFGNRLNMTIYGAVGGFTMNGDWVLRQMAAVYSDHVDYRQEWAVLFVAQLFHCLVPGGFQDREPVQLVKGKTVHHLRGPPPGPREPVIGEHLSREPLRVGGGVLRRVTVGVVDENLGQAGDGFFGSGALRPPILSIRGSTSSARTA